MFKGSTHRFKAHEEAEQAIYVNERGASTIEWLFVATLFVLLLTTFFKIVLPKLLVYGAKTVVETVMLDRISIAPPQLGLISGEGSPQNGLTPLNLIDPTGFDQRVDGFFRTLHSSIDPEITSYGLDPAEFEFCLVVKFQGRFLTELIEGQTTTLSRSSRGLGRSCSEPFANMLINTTNSQWASLKMFRMWEDLSLIRTAYASSVSQEFIAIVGALDDDQRVCPENACIVAGPVAGQPVSLPPPDTTATPVATQTVPPTATPEETPTVAPTVTPADTETPLPSNTPSPEPTDTIAPTVTPSLSVSPANTPTTLPTITPTIIPSITPTRVSTVTPTIIPTTTPTLISTATPTVIPPTRTPRPPLTPGPVFR